MFREIPHWMTVTRCRENQTKCCVCAFWLTEHSSASSAPPLRVLHPGFRSRPPPLLPTATLNQILRSFPLFKDQGRSCRSRKPRESQNLCEGWLRRERSPAEISHCPIYPSISQVLPAHRKWDRRKRHVDGVGGRSALTSRVEFPAMGGLRSPRRRGGGGAWRWWRLLWVGGLRPGDYGRRWAQRTRNKGLSAPSRRGVSSAVAEPLGRVCAADRCLRRGVSVGSCSVPTASAAVRDPARRHLLLREPAARPRAHDGADFR